MAKPSKTTSRKATAPTAQQRAQTQARDAAHRLAAARDNAVSVVVNAAAANLAAMQNRYGQDGPSVAADSGAQAKVLGDYPSAKETRLHTGHRPRGGSDNSHADPITRDNLRRDGKSLGRGNNDARAIAKRLADMLVGDGLVVKSTATDEAWAREATARFNEWMSSTAPDRLGRTTGWQLLYKAMKVPVTEGDGIFIKLADQTLQWIDGELIKNKNGTMDTPTEVGGATISNGRIVAYNVTEWNVSGTGTTMGGKAVNAENAIWVGNIADDGINQVRSVPMIQACINALGLVDDVERNTAVAIATAALFSIVIKTENPADTQAGMEALGRSEDQESSGPASFRLEPGIAKYLKVGETMDQVKPEHPTTNVMEFNKSQVAKCAADIGLSRAITHLDMTELNASNAKALVSIIGRCLEHQASQPVNITRNLYIWKIGGDIIAGRIPFTADWDKVDVMPKAMPMPDTLAELQVAVTAINNNLSTGERESERLGMGSFDAIVARRGKEVEMEKKAGVPRVLMPGAGPKVETAGQTAPAGEKVAGG